MAQLDVHRPIRRVEFDVGLDCERIAGEQVRVLTRYAQPGRLAVQRLCPPASPAQLGGWNLSIKRKVEVSTLFDAQMAWRVSGAGKGAAHMRVDRHRLPADVRSRLYGGLLGRTTLQVGGFVLVGSKCWPWMVA